MASKYKKRADGRYLVQVQIGIQENGRPKYKNLYARTQQELEKKERDFRQDLERGIIVDDEGFTVEKWAQHWLKVYKSNVGYYTYEMYRKVIEAYIIPEFGHVKLKNLKTYHIQALINKKAQQGLTRTLEKIKITLGQIIRQAIINELIYKDIMLGIELPQKQKKEKRSLTDSEIFLIQNSGLPIKEKTFIVLLIYTGLRRSEALSLMRKDVDIKNKMLIVNKSIYFKGNAPVLRHSTKSSAGTRAVPIPQILYELLVEYLKNKQELILFPSSSGDFMTNSIFRRFWDNAVEFIENETMENNIKTFNTTKDITPHVCRHTYATILYKSDVDMKVAQRLLGHSSIRVTMDIYTHLDNDKIISAKRNIDVFVKNIDKNKAKKSRAGKRSVNS